MMTETAIGQDVCETCGAEVRKESLFCYNCGKSVGGEQPEPEVDASSSEPEDVPARAPLRSAASLRKQRRAANRQPVQITWEPREGSSGAFIVASIVLTVGALVLLLLALYMR